MAKVNCEGCHNECDFDVFCSCLSSNVKDIHGADKNAPRTSTSIRCEHCGEALVKPNAVLFKQPLPQQFFKCAEEDKSEMDLLIVAGTSLLVSPVNSLVNLVGRNTIRVVVDRNPVGEDLGLFSERRDLFLQGECDDIFLDLISKLGWLEDLDSSRLPEASAKKVQRFQQDKV